MPDNVAGTAETMTSDDVELVTWATDHTRIVRLHIDTAKRILATYAALAERTAELQANCSQAEDALVREVIALKSSLALARRDGERLDWLEADALKEAMTLHDGLLPIKGRMQTRGLGFGPYLRRSLREALDHAMSASPPPETTEDH